MNETVIGLLMFAGYVMAIRALYRHFHGNKELDAGHALIEMRLWIDSHTPGGR